MTENDFTHVCETCPLRSLVDLEKTEQFLINGQTYFLKDELNVRTIDLAGRTTLGRETDRLVEKLQNRIEECEGPLARPVRRSVKCPIGLGIVSMRAARSGN